MNSWVDSAAVDCCVVVVTFNSASQLPGLLASLTPAADGLHLRVIVVDNGSTDNTSDVLLAFPGVRWLPSGTNLGYARGINAAREFVGSCRGVLVINPDLQLAAGSIRMLLNAVEQPGVGVSVPTLLNRDGSRFPSLRREPTVLRAIGDALFGGRPRGRPVWLTERIWGDTPGCERVAWAGGAVLMISTLCDSDVGPWDDKRFFLYSEETDYARRVRDAGYRIEYVREAFALHEGGASGTSVGLTALAAVNRLRYYEKYHGRAISTPFRLAVLLGETMRAISPGHRAAARFAFPQVLGWTTGWAKVGLPRSAQWRGELAAYIGRTCLACAYELYQALEEGRRDR